MITANAKPLAEVFGFVRDCRRVLVLGCGECVTVCQVGGEKETAVLAQALRLKARAEGLDIEFIEDTVQRQCEPEFVEPVLAAMADVDAVLSLACGVGVNFLSDLGPAVPVYPAVDTTFMGAAVQHGEWVELCAGCGQCILHLTGGICPIARCPKSILNGPCGGTKDGMCEMSTDDRPIPCVWVEIIERCRALGTEAALEEVLAPKDWSPARDGGPRRRLRPDLMIADEGSDA
jgi:ferredoxin